MVLNNEEFSNRPPFNKIYDIFVVEKLNVYGKRGTRIKNF